MKTKISKTRIRCNTIHPIPRIPLSLFQLQGENRGAVHSDEQPGRGWSRGGEFLNFNNVLTITITITIIRCHQRPDHDDDDFKGCSCSGEGQHISGLGQLPTGGCLIVRHVYCLLSLETSLLLYILTISANYMHICNFSPTGRCKIVLFPVGMSSYFLFTNIWPSHKIHPFFHSHDL